MDVFDEKGNRQSFCDWFKVNRISRQHRGSDIVTRIVHFDFKNQLEILGQARIYFNFIWPREGLVYFEPI
jgi:hypothetical protein